MWHCSPPPQLHHRLPQRFQSAALWQMGNQKWDEMLFSISSYLPLTCLIYCQHYLNMYRTASFWGVLTLNRWLRFKAHGPCSWSQLEFLLNVWKLNSTLFYPVGRTGKNLGGSAKFWLIVEVGAVFEATSPVLDCLLGGRKGWWFF